MSATPSGTVMLLARIAAGAGAVVMRHYEAGCGVWEKADRSPVTEADREAEALILAELDRAFAGVAGGGGGGRPRRDTSHEVGARFFLVDPLDGTKEFLNRNGEFTVNIAEVVDGVPVRGVVYAPAISRMFVGDADGAFELSGDLADARAIAARVVPMDGLVAVGSRSHNDAATEDFLTTLPVKQFISAGSSLKFCLVAAGEADIYPRHGRTMEWDTARRTHAGAAGSEAAPSRAGDGAPFTLWPKPGFENPPFVARGKGSRLDPLSPSP